MVASSEGHPRLGIRDRPSPTAPSPPRPCVEGGQCTGLLVPSEQSGDAVDDTYEGVPDPGIPIDKEVETVADGNSNRSRGQAGHVEEGRRGERHEEHGEKGPPLDPTPDPPIDRPLL